MSGFLDKMRVEPIPFEDDRWEDPSVSGWLTFFIVCAVFGLLFSLGGIWQMGVYPLWLRGVFALPSLITIYSVLSIVLRLRDAVFITICNLIFGIGMNLIMIICNLIVGHPENYLINITPVVVGVAWVLYFMKSDLVSVRFPREQRRIFVIDWILVIFTGLIFLGYSVLNVSSALAGGINTLGGKDRTEIQNFVNRYNRAGYQEIDGTSYQAMLDGNGDVVNVIVVLAGATGDERKSGLHEIAETPDFEHRFKMAMMEKQTELMDFAEVNGLTVRWLFSVNRPGDGLSVTMLPGEVKDLRRELLNKREVAVQSIRDLEKNSVELVSALQLEDTPAGVSLKGVKVSETAVICQFEFDENKGGYSNYEEAIDNFRSLRMEALLDKKLNLHPYIINLAMSGFGLKFEFSGSRSRYTKDYEILSPQDVQYMFETVPSEVR